MRKKTAHWIQQTDVFQKDKPYKACPYCGLLMKDSKYDRSWVDEMEMIDAIIDD